MAYIQPRVDHVAFRQPQAQGSVPLSIPSQQPHQPLLTTGTNIAFQTRGVADPHPGQSRQVKPLLLMTALTNHSPGQASSIQYNLTGNAPIAQPRSTTYPQNSTRPNRRTQVVHIAFRLAQAQFTAPPLSLMLNDSPPDLTLCDRILEFKDTNARTIKVILSWPGYLPRIVSIAVRSETGTLLSYHACAVQLSAVMRHYVRLCRGVMQDTSTAASPLPYDPAIYRLAPSHDIPGVSWQEIQLCALCKMAEVDGREVWRALFAVQRIGNIPIYDVDRRFMPEEVEMLF